MEFLVAQNTKIKNIHVFVRGNDAGDLWRNREVSFRPMFLPALKENTAITVFLSPFPRPESRCSHHEWRPNPNWLLLASQEMSTGCAGVSWTHQKLWVDRRHCVLLWIGKILAIQWKRREQTRPDRAIDLTYCPRDYWAKLEVIRREVVCREDMPPSDSSKWSSKSRHST